MEHDDPHRLILSRDGLIVLQAAKCTVVNDHWWIVAVEGDHQEALELVGQARARLARRGATRINVEPEEVRPDLGRTFYAEAGFRPSVADDRGRYPMGLDLAV